MIRMEASTTIDRPLGDVFSFVADTTNDPAWHTDLLEVHRRGAGPTGPGSEFDVRIQPFMGQSSGILRVTRFEPNQMLELRGRMGPMEPIIRYSFTTWDGGSQVRREVTLQPTGVMRLLQPLMRPTLVKRNRQFLVNLKRVLEASWFTARGFERVPALDHLQDWLTNLMTV